MDPPLTALGGSDGAGQMQHFVQADGLNLFRLRKHGHPTPSDNGFLIISLAAVSWQFLINSNSLTSNTTNTTLQAATGTLDPTNFGMYDMLVQACLATGAHCIIDVHNYARFNNLIIGQDEGGPTNAQFANLWSQIAAKARFSRVSRGHRPNGIV